MYRPGREEDVPAPFDDPQPVVEEEEALLPGDRGDASSKSSKRSVVLVGGGENCWFVGQGCVC